MNKLQELTSRREELQTKIAQMWDELMEVNEYISVIEESDKVKKNLQQTTSELAATGAFKNVRQLEIKIRDIAHRRASKLLGETLSAIDDTIRPECSYCGEIMTCKEKRTKQITSLLGDCSVTRRYYECGICRNHDIPKDRMLVDACDRRHVIYPRRRVCHVKAGRLRFV